MEVFPPSKKPVNRYTGSFMIVSFPSYANSAKTEEGGNFFFVNMRADYANFPDGRGCAVANVAFTRNVVKVNPRAAWCGNKAFGS